ncbi:MAG TPA: hypothetical protein P5526_12750 [Anaerolineae bacterium]|nr:hypothetical protein [Anaerolineae bacterium]MCB9106264.1 hypothetical protein [Anaerolineales bacterium]HRV93024.1 hypothetical protein [Anaerolineae bacterium]
MIKVIGRSGWVTGLLIFFTPVLFIFFLSSQMGYSQVKGKFDAYQDIPEITSLAELQAQPATNVVMLRGQISEETCRLIPCTTDASGGLIVYRERPAEGREVRYQEEFGYVFPPFVLALTGGHVQIMPSETRDRIIQHELHSVPSGDRRLTGFQVGDTVTVQGEWQPQPGAPSTLIDVTGITGGDKQSLMAEWQTAFQQVSWARNILGLLTGLGLILLIIQLRRSRGSNNPEETTEWHPQPPTTTEAPKASP